MRRVGVRAIYIWLALLTFLAVFAATAGAREALASRTQAIRQTVAATPPLSRTIIVTSSWNDVQGAIASENAFGPSSAPVTSSTISTIGGQLRAGFNRGAVHLAPAGSDLAMMTTGTSVVQQQLPGTGPTPVKIEVTERQPFGQQMRLAAGRLPVATPVPASGTGRPVVVKPGRKHRAPPPKLLPLQVAVSRQTAVTFGLHPGSKFLINGPELASTGKPAKISVTVTGIVTPVSAASVFWTVDPAVFAPDLQKPRNGSPYWVGAVMVGPGETQQVENYFSSANLQLEWVFPLNVAALDGQQVQPLSSALEGLTTQLPTLSGDLATVSPTLATSSDLLFTLIAFTATAQSVDTLLWLLYVSLTIAGLVVLLLAARMVAMRRSPEIALLRARGASLWQIAFGTAVGAALVCVPAAAIGVALAIVAVPGRLRAGRRVRRGVVAAGRRAARRDLRPGPHRGLAAPAAPPPSR